ncbi:MAG TPA: hypothetical protein VFD59_16080 [Nocardioidaceae bacterium]|nr:hypothetical protein [Nocardioidaceae bacterium]
MTRTRPQHPVPADGSPPVRVNLFDKNNKELDEIFRASDPGEIPVGETRGTVLLFPGSWVTRAIAALAFWVAWQGKVFDHEKGDLKNRVSPFRLKAIRALVFPGESWVDGRPCVVLDYSTTSSVARMVRDETRCVEPGVHLGVVWLWRRRAAYFVLRNPAHS